ncbi:hypothetical protein EXS56_03205 [Candidatus Kaiserbacteria bacterium]|nr:hypothetical protein [Candidatus Kaiserbacteria bacterium]
MRTRIHKISKYAPSIFQGRLNFSSVPRDVSLSLEHPGERIALRLLSIFLITAIAGYLYFVSASILNVIARKEALTRVSVIQGSIGGLEQHYFKLSSGISPESGSSLGLAPITKQAYVYRPGNVGAATIARNEI